MTIKKTKARGGALSHEPQRLSDDKCYYEEKRGIWLVQWVDFGNGRKVVETQIPWRMLENSLKRYRKLKRIRSAQRNTKTRKARKPQRSQS